MPTAKPQPAAATRFAKVTPEADAGKSPSELIDRRIRALPGWRGEVLSHLRALITAADPGITEEWKWNTPVWSCSGIICTGETYKKTVKLTFAKGAALPDPSKLFNSSLEGNVRRAIDFTEDAVIDARALKTLVQAAAVLNKASISSTPKRAA